MFFENFWGENMFFFQSEFIFFFDPWTGNWLRQLLGFLRKY